MSSRSREQQRATKRGPISDDLDEIRDTASQRQEDVLESRNVLDLDGHREKKQRESLVGQPNMAPRMTDSPSRDELAARLEAAEARTETRIAQLSAAMEARATASEH
jgi:hypothetical protein